MVGSGNKTKLNVQGYIHVMRMCFQPKIKMSGMFVRSGIAGCENMWKGGRSLKEKGPGEGKIRHGFCKGDIWLNMTK